MPENVRLGEVDPGQGPIGRVVLADGFIEINAGRMVRTVTVKNTGDRPIQVGSHFHFFEVNRALAFDREASLGMRLNVPAGTAVRFEPGMAKEVELTEFAGQKRVHGFNDLCNGSVTSFRTAADAIDKAQRYGFQGARGGTDK